MESYFIGIDVGTQGARIVLLGPKGEVVCEKGQDFLLNDQSREEQSPFMWWETCLRILHELIQDVRQNVDVQLIKAIAVTSTSGTVIPLDKDNKPLHHALMYSDKRSAEVAGVCKEAAVSFFGSHPGYTGFNASSGLCKMVWYVNHFPEKAAQINKWVHAADYITGKLVGRFNISDQTNALKSGYDIFTGSWPDYLYKVLPLKKEWLPEVVSSGKPIGKLSDSLAMELGLSKDIRIVAGMTDGCASQVASGAVKSGDWNTTIGTTMVIKGVTRKPVFDPLGRLYNHKHPDGYFMPGGAGNTGADWITLEFQDELETLSAHVENNIPSGYISWPLRTEGERFPIIARHARGFEQAGLSRQEQFIANMEGVAYLEKYAYDMIEDLSGEEVKMVYTAGGGSKSDVWLKIRSNVLGLPLYKMRYVSGATGAAILAASKTCFHSLSEAVMSLTQVEKVINPERELVGKYRVLYGKFVNTLREKGYTY